MDKAGILQELQFKATRSSGPGGQNVNKVSTKIELSFDVESSNSLSHMEKERLYKKLAPRLTKENVLLLQCDESRSQHKNKELAIERLMEMTTEALKIPKRRRKTTPKKSAIEKRLKNKKRNADKKANRKNPGV